MANTILTTYMNLPNPVPGVDPGPDYANNLYSSLVILDQHDHSPGSGQQIAPNGININTDLPFQGNNATVLRSVRFQPQTVPIAASSPDLGALYEAGVDLYYNDGAGNQIRITQSGSVTGAAGTITGLPSGTASASYVSADGTFVFDQATATAANMDIATLILRYPGSYPTPAGNFIAIQAPVSLSTGYAFTLPANTPASSNSFLTSDTSGTLGYTNADESTLTVSSNLIQIKPQGVTQGLLAPRAVGQTVGAGGVALSPSCGTFSTNSTSGVAVTNLNVQLTTTGRPVMLMLAADTSGNGTDFFFNISTNILLSFNNSTLSSNVGSYLLAAPSSVLPAGHLAAIDLGVAGVPGTYTYIVTMKSGGGLVGLNYGVLIAYEL